MKIKDLITPDESVIPEALGAIDVTHCTAKYQDARKNTLLFLLPGLSFDTRELIPEMIKSNAAAIVTECISDFPKEAYSRLIEVGSARRAFAIANAKISGASLNEIKFIGVTGTNGKTSTATMIKHVLESAGMRVGFIGTGKIEYNGKLYTAANYSMTTPDPELLYPTIKEMQDDGCRVIVMEASSHALELEKLAPISFEIGIFTGLSHEHLDFHGTMEKYFIAKEKLIKKSDKAIINIDDAYGKRLYDKYEEKSTGVGVVFRGDISATEVDDDSLSGIAYLLHARSYMTRVKLPLPGLYNVYNSMMAFDAAYKMNVQPMMIKKSFEELIYIDGRCECIRDGITVIIDYAHTPDALKNLLKTVKKTLRDGQKLYIVFGCGGGRDKAKRPMMASAAEELADHVILTSDNPRDESEEDIANDTKAGFTKKNHTVILDRSEAIKYAIINAAPDDAVVIAGKGHEKYICDKNGYRYFSEKEIVSAALRLRKAEV